MFTALAAGFAVNANLKQLFDGVSIKAGVAAVSVFAVANALGRIAWGMVFDRVRASSIIQANLIGQAIASFLFFLYIEVRSRSSGFCLYCRIQLWRRSCAVRLNNSPDLGSPARRAGIWSSFFSQYSGCNLTRAFRIRLRLPGKFHLSAGRIGASAPFLPLLLSESKEIFLIPKPLEMAV